MRPACFVIGAALAIGCSASHDPSDASASDVSIDGGMDVGVVRGACEDEWDALHSARSRWVGATPLPCGSDFGHCSECFYDYSCVMGFVYIDVNGVECDTAIASLDAGRDAR